MKYECVECGEVNTVKQLGDLTVCGGKSHESLEICSACEWPNVIRTTLINSSDKYRDAEWLRLRYEQQQLSMAAIAEMCGVSAMTILTWLGKHGITTRPRGHNKR